MSIRVACLVIFLSGLRAWTATAQTAESPVPGAMPTLTVETQPLDLEAPVGVRLALVAEVVGVPAVLEQASATADLAVAQIRVRSTAKVPLTQIALAVTAVRLSGGTPVRRTIQVPVTLAPGQASTVNITSVPAADLAAVWVPGESGALEVAVIGATASDGSQVVGDLAPPAFVPSTTTIACGDATWRPTLAGETAADPLSGQVLECDSHGLWRMPAMVSGQ